MGDYIYIGHGIPPYRDGGRFKRVLVYRDPAGGYGFASLYSNLTLCSVATTNTTEKHNPTGDNA